MSKPASLASWTGLFINTNLAIPHRSPCHDACPLPIRRRDKLVVYDVGGALVWPLNMIAWKNRGPNCSNVYYLYVLFEKMTYFCWVLRPDSTIFHPYRSASCWRIRRFGTGKTWRCWLASPDQPSGSAWICKKRKDINTARFFPCQKQKILQQEADMHW